MLVVIPNIKIVGQTVQAGEHRQTSTSMANGWTDATKCSLLRLRLPDSGMAYRLDLVDNRLPIFDQSRLPISDILSVLSFTDTDNRFSRNCRYIGVLPIYKGKITKI